MFTSAKAFFDAANGKKCVKRVQGCHTVETIPQWRKEVISLMQANNCNPEELFEDEHYITFQDKVWRKPKWRKEEVGIFKTRSADYAFTGENGRPCYGDKKGAKIIDNKLVKEYDGFTISFEILP